MAPLKKPLHFSIKWNLQNKDKYDFTNLETELNALGYSLLAKQRTKDAVAIFKLNTEEFPNSWNAFDSYAESLLKDGQKGKRY